MRSHLFRWAVVAWIGIGLSSTVVAQAQDASNSRNSSLIDQLDQFGRSLFGGLRPANDKPTATPPQRPSPHQQYNSAGAPAARAGNAGNSVRVSAPGGNPSASRGLAVETGTSVRMHHTPMAPAGPPSMPATASPATLPATTAAAPTSPPSYKAAATSDQGTPPVPGSMRLHERLSVFRQSTFDEPNEPSDNAATTPNREVASGAFSQPATSTTSTPPSNPTSLGGSSGLRQPYAPSPSTVSSPVSQPAVPQPAYTQRYGRSPISSGEATVNESHSPQPTFAPRTTGAPTLAPRMVEKSTPASSSSTFSRPEKHQPVPATPFGLQSKPSYASDSDSVSLEPSVDSEPNLNQTVSRPTLAPLQDTDTSTHLSAPGPTASAKVAKGSRSSAEEAADALFNRQGPVLNVKTIGPRRINVGKESTYELIIRNSGQVAAEEVIVTVNLPEWAEVMGAEASLGQTNSSPDIHAPKQLAWKIAHLEAKAQEKLVLRIVPRQSRPFDLAVRWDYRPIASEALIEVQEPKLEMRLDGPREVLFGKREVYRLELANTGTGEAEEVEISLLPIGTGDNVPATHRLGTLAASEKKVIEVELTARQAGVLTIKVDARGDGGVEASLAETIAVLRAALDVAVDAPRMQFVGNEVRYQLRVTNTGTAPATNLRLAARLPLGTKYVSSTGDGKLTAERGELTWTIDSLPPSGVKDIDLVCSLERSGTNRLEVSAMADGELAASAETTMQVEAMADLRLNVIDPSGPVAVGDEAVYEIVVSNRGSKGAEDVEVIAYFSRGVEPTLVEGGSHKLAPGQVVFDKLPVLAAGQSVSLKIRAKADTGGNHVFRAEVYCRSLDTKLASEETTHYYGSSGGFRERPLQARESSGTGSGDRTADRRLPGMSAPAGASPNGSTPPLLNRTRSSSNPLK